MLKVTIWINPSLFPSIIKIIYNPKNMRVGSFVLWHDNKLTLHLNACDMKALHYHLSTGNENFKLLSIAIRIPYLLIDNVLVANDTNCYIYITDFYKSFTLNQKIKLLEDTYVNSGFQDELLTLVRSIKESFNKFNKLKHPDRNLLVMSNKMNRHVEGMYNDYVEWIVSNYKPYGLMELKGIADDIILNFQKIVRDNSKPHKSNFVNTKTSDFALSLMSSKDEEGKVIIVNKDFIGTDFLKERIVFNYLDKEAMNEHQIYLYKCLHLPTPLLLKADELKSVRNSLRDCSVIFNSAMDKWNNYFIENDIPENRITFFKNEVITTLPEIQKKIDNNEILKYSIRTNTQKLSDVNVWIGEVPIPVLWDYYKYNGQIDEVEYKCLEKALENNPSLKVRIPVIVIDAEGDYPEEKEKIIGFNETEITSSRKYISVN